MALRRARNQFKESLWRRRVDRQADSGRSVREWCRRHRVKEATFHWWRRELARRDAETPVASFVPVRVAEDPAREGEPSIEIVLTDGRRVRVTGTVSRDMLTDVLDALGGRAC